mmetsp:Transcript_18374/g.42057  ORF Transcript_18374/g.42057 Transcript_18374/m.42057 type:complete len:272 (+) Transcript_18374:1544-2359(+)
MRRRDPPQPPPQPRGGLDPVPASHAGLLREHRSHQALGAGVSREASRRHSGGGLHRTRVRVGRADGDAAGQSHRAELQRGPGHVLLRGGGFGGYCGRHLSRGRRRGERLRLGNRCSRSAAGEGRRWNLACGEGQEDACRRYGSGVRHEGGRGGQGQRSRSSDQRRSRHAADILPNAEFWKGRRDKRRKAQEIGRRRWIGNWSGDGRRKGSGYVSQGHRREHGTASGPLSPTTQTILFPAKRQRTCQNRRRTTGRNHSMQIASQYHLLCPFQ